MYHEVDTSYVMMLKDITKKHVALIQRYIEPQIQDNNGVNIRSSSMWNFIADFVFRSFQVSLPSRMPLLASGLIAAEIVHDSTTPSWPTVSQRPMS